MRTPHHNSLKPRLRQLIIPIILLFVTIVTMAALNRCSQNIGAPLFGPQYPTHSGGDTLDIAIEISPLGYNISGDTITGLDYEIIRHIAEQYRPVRLHPFAPLEYAITGLQNRTFDIIISSLQSTTQLKTQLDVTTPVYIDRYVLITNAKGDTTLTATALAGDTVYIPKGSPVRQSLINLSREIGDTIYIDQTKALTTEHLILLTAAGKVPCAIVAQGEALAAAQRDPRIHICAPVTFNQFQVWAVAKDRTDHLLDSLNRHIDCFKQTPRYAALLRKYLH